MKGTHFLLSVNTSTRCENGAPPDIFGTLYHMPSVTNMIPCTIKMICLVLHREFHNFNNRIDVSELSHFGKKYCRTTSYFNRRTYLTTS